MFLRWESTKGVPSERNHFLPRPQDPGDSATCRRSCLIWRDDLLEKTSASSKCSLARRDWGINVWMSFYSHPSISSQGLPLPKSNQKTEGKGSQSMQCIEVSLWGWARRGKVERDPGGRNRECGHQQYRPQTGLVDSTNDMYDAFSLICH